jgi:polyphosphate:AMP phosphotransferase
MFEAAELGRKVSKQEYANQLLDLRAGLLEAQRELRSTNIPVIVIISGGDGAGKGETVNRLHEWLDPRGLETNVFGPLSDEEADRPDYWRFWRTLPARGRIGIFFGSWYTDPIVKRVYGKIKNAELDERLARINFFEEMLADDGTLIVKFWLHLSKKAQKKRFEKLESDPKTAWRVSDTDWKHFKMYDRFVKVSEHALRRTDSGHAPWIVVEATDDHYRELTVGRELLEAMRRRLAKQGPKSVAEAAPAVTLPPLPSDATVSILDRVDLSQKIEDKDYDRTLLKLQGRVNGLTRAAWQKGRSTVMVFEGWDAAGKGGNIRRLTEAMDARAYRVIPIAAPTEEERGHHYLWRFWRHIPRAGHVTIFDRSWYGRVLVERVEGFAKPNEWKRAYLEINDFEEQLVESGIIVMKFWIHISADEQLRRFEERKEIAYKQHKITEEDWRNRSKWDPYEEAIGEMVVRTSTRRAPWTIVAGNDKKFARIQVLRTVADTLGEVL